MATGGESMPKDSGAVAVGRRQILRGGVAPVQADMLGATIVPGWTPGQLGPGDVLPPLWHWVAFPPTVPMEEMGIDGHPKLGAFLPDLGLNRRMWASGTLRFRRPLHVGEALTLSSEIVSVAPKESGSGPMALVTIRHEVAGEAGPAIEEEQTVVYLAIPNTFRAPKKVPAPERPAFDLPVAVTTPLLFRYSAATFNAHRIHYDRDYATGLENYPGLVVHGPLQATLLMQAAVAHRGKPPTTFHFRGLHPMFDTHDLRVMGVDEANAQMTLCTAAPDGYQGLQATAAWH
jgi:3-methylfumaryl-CoA hydratase